MLKFANKITHVVFTLTFGVLLHVCANNDDGHSNVDGMDHEPLSSPFLELQYAKTEQKYAVYEETGTPQDLPTLVWWTEQLFPHYSPYSDKLFVIQCEDASCYSTTNKRYAKKPNTRGFIFYGTDIEPDKLPLPRKKYHEWALFHEESPLNNYMLSHKAFIELFNHTATFRNESDYPLTTQNIYRKSFLTERKPVPLNVKNDLKKSKQYAPVLYVQSHCDVPSDRDRYVQELMKYVEIDSFGKCLHNKDLPEHLRDPAPNFEKDEFLDFISHYKFHIAFENANCEDYMTEKLFRPLYVGSIPIYRGSPNAEDWMPSNQSIIMADNFPSPAELAAFIKKVDANDAEYEKFLSFKENGITNDFLKKHLKEREWECNEPDQMDYFRGFECHVCRTITERMSIENTHKIDSSVSLLPPKMANNFHLGCPQPYPSLGDPDDIPRKDQWHADDWIGQYWSDYDKARAVKNMILAKEKSAKSFMKYYRETASKN